MASDVNFSLVSALADASGVRRPESRAADATSASARENASAWDKGNAENSSFNRLVSDEAATARAASQARSRPAAQRSMPGRVTQPEHREAPESPKASEQQASREPSAPAEKPRPAAAENHKTTSCIGPAGDERAETPIEPCAPKAEDAESEHVICIGVAPQPETPLPDPADLVSLMESGPPGETALTDTLSPDGVLPGMVAALPTTPAPQTTGVPIATDAAALSVAGVAAGVPAIVAKAVETAETAINTAASEEAEASEAPDLAGLNLPKTSGEATKAASETAKATTTGTESAEGKIRGMTKSEAGDRAEAVANKSTTPNLHPSRAAHFADMLEGFGASNAIHRPADILAGLDRSVVAQALNRNVEVSRPTPLQMLPIEIGMQAVRGVTNFQIRLDPAELGRVDVKLQIHENGEVNASLVVDRVETLQMLRRDASTLQNAFEQAGLKQSPDGLSFSLRGEGQQGQQQEQRSKGGSSDTLDEVALQAQIGDAVMRRVHVPNSSIDRMV